MQAVRLHQHGDPAAVLVVEDVAVPAPGRGEVLVRMQASPINPSDVLFIEGHYGQKPQLPAVPGFEGVGIVQSSGPGLLGKLLVGKRVAAINRRGGNWAEQAVIPATQAVPLPAELPLEQAATFFVNPATAVVMTRKVLGVRRGEWLLQSAAASSLGRMIVRLGRHSGFRTLNIVRRESQVEELKGLGADEVLRFDAASDDPQLLIEQVRGLTGGGVRYAVDAVAGEVGSALVRCLSPRGRLLIYGTLADAPLKVAARSLIGRQSRIEGFWLGLWMDRQSLPAKILLLRQITRLIRAGVLTSEIGKTCRLADVVDHFRAEENSETRGKTLLTVGNL